MTNEEKLEIINKVLNVCYETINLNIHNNKLIPKELTTNFKDITQAIYNLESTRLLLEPIENNLFEEEKPTTYICPKCNKEVDVYGNFISGMCYDCNKKLVKKKD